MKNVAIIIVLLSSLAFAEVYNETGKTDSLSSCRKDLGSGLSYSLGLILGEPAVVRPKFIVSNILNDYELQVYGMYYGSEYNFGVDLNYIVSKNDNFSHSIGLGGGMEKGYEMEKNKFLGYGVGYSESLFSAFVRINYSFRWKFLFLQTGIAVGSGNYSILRFKPQLGLMYNF